MKKIVCLVLALSMIAATAMIFAGCGDDKSKTDNTEPTKATEAATDATSETTATTALSTVSPDRLETLAPQNTDADVTESQQSQDDDNEQDYYNLYGGLSGQAAILKALDCAGYGYQCVYYDQRYLRNQEAWYIGIQASDGSDSEVYYLYVNDSMCVPVNEIPTIGGNNNEDSGVFEENFAGISEQEAIFKALGSVEGEYACVSSEQGGVAATEYWVIGVQDMNDPSGDILYVYVNSENCFVQ